MAPPDSHQNGHPAAEYADREDGVGRRSANIDNADSPGHFRASERTPLLATDLPADMLPHAAVKYKVISMCAIFLFVIDVGTFIMDAPMQQLMEDVICRDRFPDHPIGKDGIGDGRCKTAEVQEALANLKSMKVVAQMLCRESPFLRTETTQADFCKDSSCKCRTVLSPISLGDVLSSSWPFSG